MSIFEKNLEYIGEHNSALCVQLREHDFPDTAIFQLANASSGDTNLVYKGIPLHCNNNPQQEALAEFQKASNSRIIVIMGLGLGYLLKRVFINSNAKIIVYEPNMDILKFTLEAVDFSQELQSERIFVAASFQELNSILSEVYSYKGKIDVLKLNSANKLYPDEIKELSCELPRIDADLRSNFATLFNNSFYWLTNGLHRFMPEKPDFSLNILENKFKNKAALIVSAGPSLDKNIEIIKNNRDKFIIFCVNVAYKKLVTNGITPDFTIYIDFANYLTTIKDFEHSKTNIINHISSCRHIFKELEPNKFFTFYCKNDLFSRWVSKIAGFSLEEYEAKGSVSHLALLSAFNMGCSPIIMTGQDLAYTGGNYYSSGSFWGEEINEENKGKFEDIEKTGTIEVKGQNEENLKTSPDYAGFIKNFEEFAQEKQNEVKLINCSTGGAQINGFENKNLQEVSDKLELINLNINEFLANITQNENDPIQANYNNIINELKIFAEDLKKAELTVNKGLISSRKFHQELIKRQINPLKIKKLINENLTLFNEIDNNLFKKWDFSMYLAFKELSEFYALLDDELNSGNLSSIKNLKTCSYNLFNLLDSRLKYLLNAILIENIFKNTEGNG